MEIGILCQELVQASQERGWKLRAFYSGAFMTALEMAGISVTILRGVNDEIVKCLNLEVGAPGWSPKSVSCLKSIGEVKTIKDHLEKQQSKGTKNLIINMASLLSQPLLFVE